jgi:uncharacterized surface protein with fasciclin (FAS1) repeats
MTKPRRLTTLIAALFAVAALAVFVSACGEDDNGGTATAGQAETSESAPDARQQDIVALAQGERDLSTLVKAVGAAKLVDTLQGKGPYTVFAPTNEAFATLGKQQLSELLKPENRDQLRKVLTYHVVPGELTADQLKDGQKLKTVQGETLTVRVSGGKVRINDATVVKPDVDASNGVVHVIDGVLTPPQ